MRQENRPRYDIEPHIKQIKDIGPCCNDNGRGLIFVSF